MYTLTCKYCGNTFEAKKKDMTTCNDCKNRPCEVCGKPFIHEWPYDQHCCSKECRKIWKSDPNRNKEWTAKREATVQERYGVKNVTYVQDVKDKSNSTKAAAKAQRDAVREEEKKKLQAEKAERKRIEKLEKEKALKRSRLRECKACGKKFLPTSGRNYYCQRDHYGTCKICGESYLIKYEDLPYDRNVCYKSECATQWRIQRNIEIYGIPDPGNSPEAMEKRKHTNLERYGVDNPAKCEDFRDKYVDTLWSNWGKGAPEVVKKRRETCLKKYGVSNPRKSPEIIEKCKQTCLQKYGQEYPPQSLKSMQTPESQKRAMLNRVSGVNRDFKKLLDEVGWNAQFEFELEGKWFDLWTEGSPILVEIDPTYSHHTEGKEVGKSMEPVEFDYHLTKSELARKHGYHCVHIFDWDDRYQVIQMLKKDRTRIYARKCKVVEIDNETARNFESVYHLQGPVKNQAVCLGLDYEGELIEVMTFGLPRYNKNYEWELLRLCTHFDYTVVGGASKLFKYFIRTYFPKSILSYCDRAKFSGDVYTNIGMTLHHTTDPAKIWSKGTRKITSNLLRQRGYDQLFGTNYGKGTSNEALMIENNWHAVYDCGQLVFEWEA